MLIALTMICSCQKQDSLAEAQLAQRKTELDTREETLIQIEKAVDEREKAVAEREKAVADTRIIQSQRQAPDAAQAEAERQKVQQLAPELRARMLELSRVNARSAEHNPATQRPPSVGTQRSLDGAMKKPMGSGFVSPEAEVPHADASSPSPSPTPQ